MNSTDQGGDMASEPVITTEGFPQPPSTGVHNRQSGSHTTTAEATQLWAHVDDLAGLMEEAAENFARLQTAFDRLWCAFLLVSLQCVLLLALVAWRLS